MPFIIGINPVEKRRQNAKGKTKRTPTMSKGKPAMASKKTTKKGSTDAGKIKYRTRVKEVIKYRNRPKQAAKTVYRKKASTSDALNLGRVFRAAGAVSLGMIVAKVAVNKLTEGGSEKMAWSWPNIFMAAGSSVIAAFIMGAFGLKKPTVALVAVGGVGLAMYKVFTCKVAPRWAFTEDWFGAEDDLIPMGMGEDELDVLDFEPAMSGMGATDGGGTVVARNPYMGEADVTGGGGRLVPRNPAMGDNDYGDISNAARLAYSATGGMM